MKLKIGIQRVGCIVFGRILEQDEDLRRAEIVVKGGKVVKRIRSIFCPALSVEGDLWIRGYGHSADNKWFAHAYQEESDAIQAVEDIKMLVAQVNNKTPEVNDCGLEVIE